MPYVAEYAEAMIARGGEAEFSRGLRMIVDGLVRQTDQARPEA
jgi:hypothetical protein